MQISGTGSVPQLQLRLPAQTLQGIVLQDGATMQATVKHSESSGQLTLEVGGKLLQVISNLQLAAGISLQLRVEKTANGLILHMDETEKQRLMYQEALRRDLPRQESLRPLFRELTHWQNAAKNAAHGEARPVTPQANALPKNATVAQTTDTISTQLPRPVTQAITRLLATLPGLEQLVRSDGLQQAIARSGLFLENHLLRAAQPAELDGDIKTTLLRLAQIIRLQLAEGKPQQKVSQSHEHSPEGLQNLLRQIEAGIARIQLHQLNAVSGKTESEERLSLTLELPFYHPHSEVVDLLQIRISRDGRKHGGKDTGAWTVNLHFTPEGYGDIHAIVNLSGGKISTTFWCAEENTAQLFREQLPVLQEHLEEHGLKISHCISRCGEPAESFTKTQGTRNGLIDTQA